MKDTYQLLETMVKTAMTSKSHRSERRFNNRKEDDIINYVRTSPHWEETTSDMDNWNDVLNFVNSDGQLRISLVIDMLVVNYTPELKR